MPSPAASERGAAVAEAILDSHRKANEGAWPETIAVSIASSQLKAHRRIPLIPSFAKDSRGMYQKMVIFERA